MITADLARVEEQGVANLARAFVDSRVSSRKHTLLGGSKAQ